jgi:flagellin-like protein
MMRRVRRQERGLAEIVGTLMLVVIVVAAVTAFSLFVAAYQQQVQAQQSYVHNQALESIHFTAIRPHYNVTTKSYDSLMLTVVSNDINPTVIANLTINDEAIDSYNITASSVPLQGVTLPLTVANADFTMPAESSIVVLVAYPYSFNGNTGITLSVAQYIKINLFTGFQNDFTHVFLPPTAVIAVDAQTTGMSSVVTILDGSHSYQQAGNATIVSWNWTVNDSSSSAKENTTGSGNTTVASCLWFPTAVCYGIVASTGWPLVTGSPYVIGLLVTNSDGLVGDANLTYTPQ